MTAVGPRAMLDRLAYDMSALRHRAALERLTASWQRQGRFGPVEEHPKERLFEVLQPGAVSLPALRHFGQRVQRSTRLRCRQWHMEVDPRIEAFDARTATEGDVFDLHASAISHTCGDRYDGIWDNCLWQCVFLVDALYETCEDDDG